MRAKTRAWCGRGNKTIESTERNRPKEREREYGCINSTNSQTSQVIYFT